jgi:hypothetical protein
MISDYFEDIDIISKIDTSDDLGGFTTVYKKIGTIKGLLQRSSTSERTIAAQLGVSAVYTLMTFKTEPLCSSIIPNVIAKSKTITAIVTSIEMDGNPNTDMKDIAQWQSESYTLPEGATIQ